MFIIFPSAGSQGGKGNYLCGESHIIPLPIIAPNYRGGFATWDYVTGTNVSASAQMSYTTGSGGTKITITTVQRNASGATTAGNPAMYWMVLGTV